MNPGASSLAGQDRDGVIRDAHVAQWLWAMFTTQHAAPWLNGEQSRWAVAHLQACESCRAEIGVLLSMASASPEIPPALRALLAHVSPGSAPDPDSAIAVAPDDEDLAMYLALMETSDAETAARLFPDLAAHIAVCSLCQADVEGVRAALADERQEIQAAAEPRGFWEIPNAWERRLRAPYQVWVGPRALHITSTLVDSQIETPPGISDPLSGERFTVALCEDPASAREAWVNVQVEMHALFAQRISGHIRAFRALTETSSDPVAGVQWRLEPMSPALPDAPARAGATDSDGAAQFTINGFGDYQLIFTMAGRDWIAPLAIRADASDDETGL